MSQDHSQQKFDKEIEDLLGVIEEDLTRQEEVIDMGGKKNSEAVEETEETTPMVTVKQLAGELGTTDRELRKFLRSSDFEKPGGRWEWPEGDPVLGQISAAYADRKAAKEAEDEIEEVD